MRQVVTVEQEGSDEREPPGCRQRQERSLSKRWRHRPRLRFGARPRQGRRLRVLLLHENVETFTMSRKELPRPGLVRAALATSAQTTLWRAPASRTPAPRAVAT